MNSTEREGFARRKFIQSCAAVGALGALGLNRFSWGASADGWDERQVQHLIPAASHERFLIKTSFKEALAFTPRLMVDGNPVEGFKTDLAGRFWRFDASSLKPATQYELQITDPAGKALCATWPLKTFPAPDTRPEHVRILSYTCGGGFDSAPLHGKTTFLDMAVRRRLLARGMSHAPDIVIANGDHIYWDLTTTFAKVAPEYIKKEMWGRFGELDISVPMMHPKNAATFLKICDYQIAGLYGTTLRSTPAYFPTDDHDLFENDEYDAINATLPTDTYGLLGAEQTQHLYYPEYLPDANRPLWLPGGDRARMAPDTNMTFGTLRYGTLLEAVMYDCRRYVNYKGDHAQVIPQWVEDWLIKRTVTEDTSHFLHVPSLPFAYSSGKLGDWYPDLLDAKAGKLVLYKEKPGWQQGWFGQHQRLVSAIASQQKRAPAIVQGDFHASSAGRFHRSGELELPRPIDVILTGTLGTGDLVFPSSFRAIESKPSQLIGMEEALKITEKNGFSIIDITPEKMTFTMFMYRPPQDPAEIDTMKPAMVYEVMRHA